MSSFLCKYFHIGCPPVTPPTPPANALKGCGIGIAYQNVPVEGAVAKLDGGGTFPPTNKDGYAFMNIPSGLTSTQLYITANGFVDYSKHIELPLTHGTDLCVGVTAKPEQVQCEPLVHIDTHVDPSTFSLRELARIRGAMWTVRGPWRFGPRPGSPDNITALEFLYSYGDPRNAFDLNDEQKAMLATYKKPGLTHMAFGPPSGQSYHGQYPDTDFCASVEMFEKWLDWLQTFWDYKLAPICFLHDDGATFDETVAKYDHLIRGNARAQKLMRIVVPTGWEPTRYGWSSVTWAKYCAWARDLLPNALVLIHTVADVDAPVGTDAEYDDNGKGNGPGWARVTPHIHGWLIQNGVNGGAFDKSPSQDPELAKNFAAQFDKGALGAERHGVYWHFKNQIMDWPGNSAWGPNETIYLYNAECTSYTAYWQNLPESISREWGDLAIASGADGYLDSGNVDVPPARV